VGVLLIAGVVLTVDGGGAPSVGLGVWSGAALLGMLGFFTATAATIYGVSHLPVQRSAVIMLFEIFAGGISAWLLADEAMGMQEWLGGVLILAAGFVAAVRR
jgi:drug/metabolite transporter (DMT)-like permease